jgi:maleate isomerase
MTHPARRWHPTHRIALVTPSANPAVEHEMRHLLTPEAALHVTRMPVMPGTTLEQRNAAYVEALDDCLDGFGALAMDAAIYGITGPSYAVLPDQDAATQQKVSAAIGRPMVLAARGIAESLAALGRPKLLLFSPYPGWLTERAERYWRAAGLELVESYKVSETFRAYELTPEEVADGLAKLRPPADCAVLLSGTGMPTLDAMEWMRERVGVPMLSSNLGCAYAVSTRLRLKAGPAMAACNPELAATLGA